MTSELLEGTGVGEVVAEHGRLLDAPGEQLDEAAVNPAKHKKPQSLQVCV